jgi:hypothetical protein
MFPKMVWNEFSSFSLPKMVRNGIPNFVFFRKWFGTEFQGFIIENGLEWNGFSLPRNGSERNSEVFLFH